MPVIARFRTSIPARLVLWGGSWRLAALLCSAAATNAAAGGSPAPDQVTLVAVKTLADTPLTGRVQAGSLADGLKLENPDDGTLTGVPADEVVQIVVTSEGARGTPGPHRTSSWPRAPVELRLVGGDRLYGKPVRPIDQAEDDGHQEVVRFETAILDALEVPLDRIDRWINTTSYPLSAGEVPSPSSKVQSPEPNPHSAFRIPHSDHPPSPQPSDDLLWLSNGDVLSGVLLAIDDRGIVFESERAALTVSHAQVAAVDLAAEPRQEGLGLRARITFADGSRVTTDDLTYTEAGLALPLFGGTRRSVRWERVLRVEVLGGRWVWLSDLEPISAQVTPMLSVGWPYVKDAAVLGRPMRIANRAFDRGLGVHSESSLLFDLAGEYSEWVAYLGLDDSAGPLADVTAEVLVDGRVRYRQEHVRAGRLWGPIRIDVHGAARMELRALFGENAAVQDRLNWAEAALIRRGNAGNEATRTAPATQ